MSRINVVVEERFGRYSVTGFVNMKEVISFSNNVQNTWGVGSSTCLPFNLELAKDYIECVNQTLSKVLEIQSAGVI